MERYAQLPRSRLGGSVVPDGCRPSLSSPEARFWPLGSAEARFRAGLRPPPKLAVHISRRQLSLRLSEAEMQETGLTRSDEQARTRRKVGQQATVSAQHCANTCSDATRCAAGPSRRDVGRAFGCGRVCNTRPTLARAGLAPHSAPWFARPRPFGSLPYLVHETTNRLRCGIRIQGILSGDYESCSRADEAFCTRA